MALGFSKNMNIQLLIALMKKHGIKRVITSPGGTNLEFTVGLQYDGGFELFSSVDERSAAYMACGMVGETSEPVAITCTESTASRDYFPGLTEAFYRKLPILVITGVHRYSQIGHLQPQIIDRSVSPVDVFKAKVQLPIIKDEEDIWNSELLINKAILALKRSGGGPVHIDLPCCNDDYDFSTKELPEVKAIKRYYYNDELPTLPSGKIAIFIGSHLAFDENKTKAIDEFCNIYNSVVFCDHTSGYKGNYAVHAAITSLQNCEYEMYENIDLLIHMGEAPADEATMRKLARTKQVWRVNPDGELRDSFKKLYAVFEMEEYYFFKYYSAKAVTIVHKENYLEICKESIRKINVPLNELPFSNVYMASIIEPRLPKNSIIHLGLSNTIRAWSMFELPHSVKSSSNVGCRGIDGVLSTVVGASMINKDQLHFCVIGDLTFFYDMNALGNRDISNNLRILLVNNGGGGVFKHKGAPGYRFFGDEVTNMYIAAGGHFGNKSRTLVKHFAEDLGFDYITASTKEEFNLLYERFINTELSEKSILFEVFTDDEDEREAFNMMSSIDVSNSLRVKQLAKQVLGQSGTKIVKRIISR